MASPAKPTATICQATVEQGKALQREDWSPDRKTIPTNKNQASKTVLPHGQEMEIKVAMATSSDA